MNTRLTRRKFLRYTSAATGALFLPRPLTPWHPTTDAARIACVGVGGRGWNNAHGCSQAGAEIVAFCDVETGRAMRKGGVLVAAKKWPKARRYTDWRVMLEKEQGKIDGVTVSTPDHMHAPITMSAIHRGLATYTEKPLTRTVHEARQLTLAAKQAGVATQMGNQHHSGTNYRTLVHLLQTGAIGKIKEAHAWSNRPSWPQGIDRPAQTSAIPDGFHWDLWLGGAPERAFTEKTYHPFAWRGWFDFGAGALGDMGCHIIDPVVWGLDLGAPSRVHCEAPEPKGETFPAWEIIRYSFSGTRFTAKDTIDVIWYDGGKKPDPSLARLSKSMELPANGTLFIGEKGQILTSHGKPPVLLPQKKFEDYEVPKLERINHHGSWLDAIRGEGTTTSHFDYAGPLTETVLLGTIACRFPGESLEWDAAELKFKGNSKANDFIRQDYRKGWAVDGLV